MNIMTMSSKYGVVRPRTLRVLAAVMSLSRTGSVTLRGIANTLDICHNAVDASLDRLEKRGLITRERGRRNTVRACVEFIPSENLGRE